MLIQEMHNKVEVRLQKLASHVYDWIRSEYIDSFLNDNILAYVKSRVNSFSQTSNAPFHRNLKNLEDLRSLIVSSRILAFKQGEYFLIRTPGDYMMLVSGTANLSDACNYVSLPNTVDYLELFTRFSLPFNVTKLSLGAQELMGFPGFDDPIMSFENHQRMQGIYSNQFSDIYYNSGKYELIQKPDNELSPLNILTTTVSENFSLGNRVWKVHQESDLKNVTATRFRIIRSEEFTHYLDHPFAKSTAQAPSGYIDQEFIKLHHANRFILRSAELVYVRRPQLVNLYLGIDCDLPEHTHQEIIDNTVVDILETIESGRIQSRLAINSQNQ